MAKPIITAERLRELLHYDPETGNFTWRVSRGKVKIGRIAGCLNVDGYICIAIDSWPYVAHRLVWLYVHGQWPKLQIDHINGCRTNNQLANLRDISCKENNQNRRIAPKTNLSGGLLGVTRSPNDRGWRSRIRVDGKKINLGTHATPELAQNAYLEAKRLYHPGCTI